MKLWHAILYGARMAAGLLFAFNAFAFAGLAQDSSTAASPTAAPSSAASPTTAPSTVAPPDSLMQQKKAVPAEVPLTPSLFDTIAGPLPEVVKAGKRPYLVVGDIEVTANKAVTIGPGVVFLFKNFTGMHVSGKLTVEGTRESPVIFTSENDRSVNHATALYPNPYDWNGIYIHADAIGSSMAFCKVMYSVYGIISETKFIKLDPVILMLNGKSNLVIEGKEQPVTDKPYRYVLSTKDVVAEGVPVKILTDPLAKRRAALRYSGIVVGMAASVAAVYYGLQWNKDQANLSSMSTNDPLALRSYNESDWFSVRSRRNNDIYYTAIGGVLGLIGYVGFGWSFTF